MTNTKTPIQAQIFSILSCVSYDMREAVEKDLWAMVGQIQAELNLANEQCEALGRDLDKVATNIERWEQEAIRPDEWKLREWAMDLRKAIAKCEAKS